HQLLPFLPKAAYSLEQVVGKQRGLFIPSLKQGAVWLVSCNSGAGNTAHAGSLTQDDLNLARAWADQEPEPATTLPAPARRRRARGQSKRRRLPPDDTPLARLEAEATHVRRRPL